jgi:hypothetical protein
MDAFRRSLSFATFSLDAVPGSDRQAAQSSHFADAVPGDLRMVVHEVWRWTTTELSSNLCCSPRGPGASVTGSFTEAPGGAELHQAGEPAPADLLDPWAFHEQVPVPQSQGRRAGWSPNGRTPHDLNNWAPSGECSTPNRRYSPTC